jgi:hypothetical protein
VPVSDFVRDFTAAFVVPTESLFFSMVTSSCSDDDAKREANSLEISLVDSDVEYPDRDRRSRGRSTSRGRGATGESCRSQPRKKRARQASTAYKEANSFLNFMGGGAVVLQRKSAPPAERSKCWSGMHWIPVDVEQHGDQGITRNRFDEL